MKTIIRQHQRGLLWKNGQLVGWLEPGKHTLRAWFGAELKVTLLDLDEGYEELTPELEAVLPEGVGVRLVVPAKHLACVAIDGVPEAVLKPGRWVLWQVRAEVTAEVFRADGVLVELPEDYWELAPSREYQVTRVAPHQRALLVVNGVIERVLEPGRYLVNHVAGDVSVLYAEMREQEIQIVGQEVMTADKVTIRVNVIVKYRVVDPVAATYEVTDLNSAIYAQAQMAARKFVAGRTVDEMLEARNEAAELMANDVRGRSAGWGVEIGAVDLKDVVLPGEMKAILNRVIEAEKQAQANGIMRREETAATRSLANTAKLLEQNPTLMRLKELEAMKEIVGNIDKVTLVSGTGDLLGRSLMLGE